VGLLGRGRSRIERVEVVVFWAKGGEEEIGGLQVV
jgi:hypothetical protein